MFNRLFRNFYVITGFSVTAELLLTWIQSKSLFKPILEHKSKKAEAEIRVLRENEN